MTDFFENPIKIEYKGKVQKENSFDEIKNLSILIYKTNYSIKVIKPDMVDFKVGDNFIHIKPLNSQDITINIGEYQYNIKHAQELLIDGKGNVSFKEQADPVNIEVQKNNGNNKVLIENTVVSLINSVYEKLNSVLKSNKQSTLKIEKNILGLVDILRIDDSDQTTRSEYLGDDIQGIIESIKTINSLIKKGNNIKKALFTSYENKISQIVKNIISELNYIQTKNTNSNLKNLTIEHGDLFSTFLKKVEDLDFNFDYNNSLKNEKKFKDLKEIFNYLITNEKVEDLT